MSTFSGLLIDPSLQFLAIDYFESRVFNCEYFFLSHHHCDHMAGIFTKSFANLINNSRSKHLYCSSITAHFLHKNEKVFIHEDRIKTLLIDKPIIITHPSVETYVIITALPANHCPGSIMLLIEYQDKRILYSGDIRVTVNDLKKIQGSLTNTDGSVIQIDDLYLDTTFAVESKYDEIPTREESEETLIILMKDFLNLSKNHKVILKMPSRFGYERFYLNIKKTLNIFVLIHDDDYKYYRHVEEMQDCVIPVSNIVDSTWRVHSCRYSECQFFEEKFIQIFRPCAMSFIHYNIKGTKLHEKTQVPYNVDPSGVIRVMYSTHCSLNELRDINNLLKPKNLIPSVQGDISYQNIVKLINSFKKSVDYIPKKGLNVLPCDKRKRSISKCLKFSIIDD